MVKAIRSISFEGQSLFIDSVHVWELAASEFICTLRVNVDMHGSVTKQGKLQQDIVHRISHLGFKEANITCQINFIAPVDPENELMGELDVLVPKFK